MKTKTKMPKNTDKASTQRVHLEFQQEHAQSVFIAGTFNDWNPGATLMITSGNGKWMKILNLAPGRYEYRYVVDGRWMADPKAEQTANAYGDFNSVLVVKAYQEVKTSPGLNSKVKI